MARAFARPGLMIALALLAVQCGAGGKYNFDVVYHPLKAEKPFFLSFEELNYEVIKSDPMKYRGAKLGWFGVVSKFKENKDGTITLILMHRAYRERHLCDDNLEKSSCRVTVSDKSNGTFSTTFTPRPDDADGQNAINFRSLVRIYGTPTGEYDNDGGPVLTCDYYRHWPPGAYVTTAAAEVLRQ